MSMLHDAHCVLLGPEKREEEREEEREEGWEEQRRQQICLVEGAAERSGYSPGPVLGLLARCERGDCGLAELEFRGAHTAPPDVQEPTGSSTALVLLLLLRLLLPGLLLGGSIGMPRALPCSPTSR